ncbi:MAG: Fur family transcriptional regulator [Dehalococcoidales bacterium]
MAIKKANTDIKGKSLSSAGLRMTSQRAIIMDIINRGDTHMDADEVYNQARQIQPNISLSTVYRNLNTLKDLGLIQELHFNDSHHHYEVKPPTEHQHLVCLSCGKVIEFECKLCSRMKEEIAREEDFEITSAEVQLTGYCADCRKKGSDLDQT